MPAPGKTDTRTTVHCRAGAGKTKEALSNDLCLAVVKVMRTAVETHKATIVESALDCLQKLITHRSHTCQLSGRLLALGLPCLHLPIAVLQMFAMPLPSLHMLLVGIVLLHMSAGH